MFGTEENAITEEEIKVNSDSEIQGDLDNSADEEHKDENEAGDTEDQKTFEIPEELTKEGISEGFIKKFYGKDEQIELNPASIRMLKSAYSSEKAMRQIEAEKQKAVEVQKETEVKQISETVKSNYEKLVQGIAQKKASEFKQIEDLAASNGQITWLDGQVYQVTPENKHIFREKLAEHYAANQKEIESAFEIANKQALTKKQQYAKEQSESGYQKYIESKKEIFDKEPELLEAVNFLKKETAYNPELVEDFTKLFPAYYEKRRERELKVEKMKAENGGDLEKLSGIGKLSSSGKTITKNLKGAEALELAKKGGSAWADYVKKL